MSDTIAAIATPAGKGGVGIVRISGPKTQLIAAAVLGECPKPRVATFSEFNNEKQETLDHGIALYFKAPHSFTGEDVLELQGHGGPVVMDCVLRAVLGAGARLANPGEFSERAFLNGKIDLAQAEAIADLINASSEHAAQSATRSLQGEFSKQINVLLAQLTQLRMMVEAAIDFPEEEIDFIAESTVVADLQALLEQLDQINKAAKQGVLLQEGLSVVIAGAPNAGKSSLLNLLSGRDSAIVTDIPGTTRDTLREYIQIDGLPLHILDTAGIRQTDDVVEQEGVRRAEAAMKSADLILWIEDATSPTSLFTLSDTPTVIIKNKVDKLNESPSINLQSKIPEIKLSAKTGEGLSLLHDYLKRFAGFEEGEGGFIARRRHLDAIKRCCQFIESGLAQIKQENASELLAEELRNAQNALSEITGQFTADDLLGKIFSSFCIGK